jgi:hypothetical protein
MLEKIADCRRTKLSLTIKLLNLDPLRTTAHVSPEFVLSLK